MNVKEFDTALYHQLYDFFYDHEFEMVADKKQFRRTLPNGFQSILFSVSELDEEIWLEVNLGVRIHAVEEVVQQFLDNSITYRDEALTLVASIGKLTNNKYFRYKINTPEDLKDVCEAMKLFMQQQGFAFLDNHSSITSLDKLYNSNPTKPTRYLYNQMHRCFKGAVLAKLSDRKQYAKVLDSYQYFLDKLGAKPTLAEKYDKLCNYLLYYNPN